MRVVLCNCPAPEAEGLARQLVTEGLAACVNVLEGVKSFYRWHGELQEDVEHTLLIKVSADKLGALGDRIRALHSYDTVEVVVLSVDVAASDPDYVAWVRGS